MRIVITILLTISILSPIANFADEQDNFFDLSLAQMLQISINVAGSAVQNVGLSQNTVTANSFNNSRFSIPATVETIDSKAIQARGLRNVVDVAQGMTGVLSGESPSEPYSFSMRSFSRESVKVLYDGISMGVSNLNMRPIGTNNLDRVEIVKGPVVLQGGGSAGGTINIQPKRAALTPHHIQRIFSSFGNYDSRALALDACGPLSTQSAYLVDLDYSSSNGWVDNSESNSLNFSGSLIWQWQSNLSLTLSYDHFSDELPGYWGTPLTPSTDAEHPVAVVRDTQNRVIDRSLRFTNYNVSDHVIDSDSDWLKAKLNWTPDTDHGGFIEIYTFNAQRHWRNAETYIYQEDSDEVLRDRLLVDHDRDIIGLRGGIHFDNNIGQLANHLSFELEYSDNQFGRAVGFEPVDFFVDLVDLNNPNAGIFNAADIEQRNDSLDEITSALIFENRLDLTDSLFFDIGWRHEWITFDQKRFNFDGTTRTDRGETIELNSYRIALLREINSTLSIYSQYGYQHEALYEALINFSLDGLRGFEMPKVNQLEIGLKSYLFEQKMELTLAAFQIQKRAKVTLEDGFQVNQQDANGLELTTKFNASNRFKIGGNFSYVDSQFGRYYDALFEINADHNKPQNAPTTMASIWMSLDQIGGIPLEVGTNYNYTSGVYSTNSNQVEYKGYSLLNAFIAYTSKNYRIALHGRNLSDKLYVPFSDPYYTDQVLLGSPRTVELNFRIAL